MKRKMQSLMMVILLGAMLPMQGMLPRTAGRVVQGGRAFGTTPTAAAKEFTLTEKVGKPSKRLISKKKSLVLAPDSTAALTVPNVQEAFQAGANEPKTGFFKNWWDRTFGRKTETSFETGAAAGQKGSWWSSMKASLGNLMAYWFGRKREAAQSMSPEVMEQAITVEPVPSAQQILLLPEVAQVAQIEPTSPIQKAPSGIMSKLKKMFSNTEQQQKNIEKGIEDIVSSIPDRWQVKNFKKLVEANGGDYSILNTYKPQRRGGSSVLDIMLNNYLRNAFYQYRDDKGLDTDALEAFYKMGARFTPEEIKELENSEWCAWFTKEIKLDQNVGNFTVRELQTLFSRLLNIHNILQSIHFDIPGDVVNWEEMAVCRSLLPLISRDLNSTTVNQLKKAPERWIDYRRGGGFDSNDIIKSLEKLGFSLDGDNKQQETE